jgi:SAM-dependent methyltransferase
METAHLQNLLWGMRAADWSEVQEDMFTPLFKEVLHKAQIRPGTKLLDIGCGSGIFCQMAARRGAWVSGLDAAQPLLSIARQNVPFGDFRTGQIGELPYSDQTFDVVTGFNTFQFAASPLNALREARRVSRSGARVVIAVFGKRQDCDFAACLAALSALLPPPPGAAGPFSLSSHGALQALAAQAGLAPQCVEEVDCLCDYPDEKSALRASLSSSPAIRVVLQRGEAAVREEILKALRPFKTSTGRYQLRNKALYLVARA